VNRDDDLLAAMPDPPPPRPGRRKLAIEEAMRRFDAVDGQPPVPQAAPARTPVRAFLARPQAAAFASILLVALVSSPVWLFGLGRQTHHSGPEIQRRAAHAVPSPAAPAQDVAGAAPIPAAWPASSAGPVPEADADRPTQPAQLPPAALADSRAVEPAAPPPPPPPPLPPTATAAAPITAAPAAKAERADQRVAAPPPPLAQANAPAETGGSIIVTGSRIERPQTFGREVNPDRKPIIYQPPSDDAWNACTVLDPRKNLRACRDLLDPRQPGETGRAAVQITDGLAAAWTGDLDGAIAAFGRAIAVAPHSALAYLNRGLAYQLKDEHSRALADLDAAIKSDPESASAYYHRSLLLRTMGKAKQADADAARARRLDPHNAAILRQSDGD
jgi:hypothetical protein